MATRGTELCDVAPIGKQLFLFLTMIRTDVLFVKGLIQPGIGLLMYRMGRMGL